MNRGPARQSFLYFAGGRGLLLRADTAPKPDTGMSDARSLDDLRREIDEIDDRIHEQLMRRSEIVVRIAEVKQRQCNAPVLRPGREALILRRLARRHEGAFPLPVLLHMWRELLAGHVAIQGGVSVGVLAPGDADAVRDLARGHFGAATPLRSYPTVGEIVRDVRRGAVSVGVVPVAGGATDDPWWRLLANGDGAAPAIVAMLPFWSDGPAGAEAPAALAIAMAASEPTGDDVTVLAVERTDAGGEGLHEDLRRSGLAARSLAAWRNPAAPGETSHLIAADGVLAADAPELATLRTRLGDGGVAAAIGCYARPIRMCDFRQD